MAGRVASVNQNVCVACGACMKACPRGAIQICSGCYAAIDRLTCVGCGLCAGTCPAGCIEIVGREVEKFEK